ncbi:hypothetical protein MPER_12446 [Moniliophthora perniciosa FA553]|nr:hypothetical protein MPER_12446 [Moniliophthora perniciosa FA553]
MRDIAGDNRTEASITAEIIENRFADELAKFQAPAPSEWQLGTPEQQDQLAAESSVHEESEVETVIATEDATPENVNLDISDVPTAQVVVPTEYPPHVAAPPPVNEPAPIASGSSLAAEQPAPPVYEYPASIEIQRLVPATKANRGVDQKEGAGLVVLRRRDDTMNLDGCRSPRMTSLALS